MRTKVIRHKIDSERMLPRTESEVIFVKPKKAVSGDSLSDQIACSKVCMKNYKWKEAEKDFPREPRFRFVDKFYPFAFQGKGLLIDEPQMADDIRRCEMKKEILEKHGYRYLIIKKETTLADLLEEAQSWAGPRS